MQQPPLPIRAAQYVRMSTERQDYSIEYQVAANAAYASARGYQVVRTYSDVGISGLMIDNRDGLKTLLADALGGTPDFEVVLVYDVSRWGRFQNPDQAAHYEFICSEAGVRVEYCAEPFDNDGSPTSALLKHIKRAMAAEYSRELSQKVSRARREAASQGFWGGTPIPYGLRPQITDKSGRTLEVPAGNQWRKKPGSRTRLVWGSAEEVETVRRIFRLYLAPGGSFLGIARLLNAEGKRHPSGAPWNRITVGGLLSNELYIGRLICGRWRHVLGSKERYKTPPNEWVVNDEAVRPIIARKVFAAAQTKRALRAKQVTQEEAVRDLQRLLRDHGKLTQNVLRHGKWSVGTYARIFGSMGDMRAAVGTALPPEFDDLLRKAERARAVRRANGQVKPDQQILDGLRRLLAAEGRLTPDLIQADRHLPSPASVARRFGRLAKAYELIGYQPERPSVRLLKARAARKAAREEEAPVSGR